MYQGGVGTWELAIRYSKLILDKALVTGGKVDVFSLGVNWWLSSSFGLNINYRHIILNRFDLKGLSDGIMGRVILMLE